MITPVGPLGAKGWKLPAWKAGTARQKNRARAAIFMATSTALTRALSLVPRTSSTVQSREMNTAGRSIIPPAAGLEVSMAGSFQPKACSTRPVK